MKVMDRNYQSEILSAILMEINELVQTESYNRYFKKIGKTREDFTQHLRRAIQKLEGISDDVNLGNEADVQTIKSRWLNFSKIVEENITDENVKKFKSLQAETRSLANYIISLPKTIPVLKHHNDASPRSSRSISIDLDSLESLRNKIQQQIDRDAQASDVEELKKRLKEVEGDIARMRKEKNEVLNKEQIIQDWDEKIQQTFSYLKQSTVDIESEKQKASQEYEHIMNMIYVLCVIVLVWLFAVYKVLFVSKLWFTGWMSFLPYYLPIPLFIAIFWALIVQKNRASKLSITLSDELYKIRYMEGLLLAVNKLSDTTQSSVSRINKALDLMVEIYMHQVEKLKIDEKGIEAIEEKELSTTKYLQIIDKLIGKI